MQLVYSVGILLFLCLYVVLHGVYLISELVAHAAKVLLVKDRLIKRVHKALELHIIVGFRVGKLLPQLSSLVVDLLLLVC